MKDINALTKEVISAEMQNSFFKYMRILPNPDKMFRNLGKSYSTYRELKNDPHVWSCIQSRKSGIISRDYKIIAGAADETVRNEVAKIIADLDIQELMRDILEAPLFGFQPFEVIWEITKGRRKYAYPERIIAKPQEWFAYDTKDNLRFLMQGEAEGIVPPPMKIINIRYEPSVMNPYGESLLAKSYWPVTFKKGSLRFWVNFTERYGMPFLVGKYTRGATSDEARKLAEDLANMTEDAIIVTPSDIELQMKEPIRFSSVTLYKEMIKQCNSEISKAILSQTLTTELDMGSYAASQTHFKIRREIILSDAKLVEDFFNTLIKWIVDLNFVEKKYPVFKMVTEEKDDIVLAERDNKLMQAGVKLSRDYFMETYGFKQSDIIDEN